MTTISFVVPVHNEAPALPALGENIAEVCKSEGYTYEIIFVDDGSTDGSFSAIETLSRENARIHGIQLSRNFGQTAAMSAGIHAATSPLIVTIDADLQNDPRDVPKLLAKLDEGFDVVSGIRTPRRDGLLRLIPSVLANTAISLVSGVALHDYGCTLKAYRRAFLEHVTLYGDMHRFIPIFAAWHGAKVTEIPVTHHPRSHGRSHYGLFGRTGRVLLDLVTVKFLHTFIARPMHFFGGTGAWFMFAGFLCGVAAVILKLAHIRDFVATPLPLLTVFLLSIGIVALLMGLLGELLIRIYFEQPGRKPYRIQRTIGLDPHP